MAGLPFDLSRYRRRKTAAVRVGNLCIGGDYPVRVQSMANTDTNDTEACIAQAIRIAQAGGELVRFTTQGRREAENLRNIKEGLRARGCDIPLVADIHFNPEAAFIAAAIVEKVRINPGNFAAAENLREKFTDLLNICKAHGTALRIGVNHGSLSERMMSRYGDTPTGMVESAMEFLRICVEENFDQVVLSMKSSNVRVMVHAYRLLVQAMDAERMAFPLHLGVTEAGDGEDARVKSAAGIGALLADGLGDTIRVSLTEPPENEIPVARKLVDHFACREKEKPVPVTGEACYSPYEYRRRESTHNGPPLVVGKKAGTTPDADVSPVDLPADFLISEGTLHEQRAFFLQLMAEGVKNPVIIKRTYAGDDLETLQLKAAADIGPLFLDGFGDGIWIENKSDRITPEQINSLSFAILQAARVRISRTEYIACPGCGRTLFDLTETLARVRAATAHLKGLKIGVMGCIVNGPGEMADADYGYVGAGPGRVTLYKGKEVVKRNIPEGEAIVALLDLIRQDQSIVK